MIKRLCKIVVAVLLAGSLTAASNDRFPEKQDCVAIFDFLVLLAAPGCDQNNSTQTRPNKIDAGINLLVTEGFVTTGAFDAIETHFCPLTNGLGLTPSATSIYLDDGLAQASDDTVAEVLYNEVQHIRQIREMGSQTFKCAYIESLIACNGCTDHGHTLEALAYAAQARVRDALLNRWLEKNAASQQPQSGD